MTLVAAPSYLSPSGQELVFLLLGIVVLGSAVLVVTTRQLVHAALYLVLTFGALAGCYVVLTAEVVAWVQVLIYVGAVVVLLLFGLMLTRAPIGPHPDVDSGNKPIAGAVALATAGTLVTILVDAFRTAYIAFDERAVGSARAIGKGIFQTFVLPFEVLSVLLLAALVGAIVLSRQDISGGEGEE
jgi:NADH-quinone oxidoreductase subunit J